MSNPPILWGGNDTAQLLQGKLIDKFGSNLSRVINYINNADFEKANVTGWTTYADAAATTPADGTGGTANVTFTATSTNPLRGAFSGLLTKDAANRQGQGASCDFTIARADRGRPVSFSFDYEIASGTYAAGDVGVYIYDVTNGTLITPSVVNVPTGAGTLRGFFIASTSTSYRLILHVASTSASAYTLAVDNFNAGPQRELNVGANTDWQSYTPVLFGSSNGLAFTNVTSQGRYKQVGDELLVQFNCQFSGVPGTGTGQFCITLPSGLTVDVTKLPTNSSSGINVVGFGYTRDAATQNYAITVQGNAQTPSAGGQGLTISLADQGGASPEVTATVPFSYGSGDFLTATFRVPIAGWSSNTTALTASDPDFAYNTSTSTTTDETSFGNGLIGASLQAFAPGGTASIRKRVRFQTPIQPTDKFKLKLKSSGATAWVNFDERLAGFSANDAGTIFYGYQLVQVNSTDMDVYFYSAAAPGISWGAGLGSWAVEKQSGQTVGILPVSARNVVGDTSGTTVPAGMIGETVFTNLGVSVILTGLSGATNTIMSETLPRGVWLVWGVVTFTRGVTWTYATYPLLSASLSLTNTYDIAHSHQQSQILGAVDGQVLGQLSINPRVVVSDGTQLVYLLGAVSYASGADTGVWEAGSGRTGIRRVRIA